MLTEPEFYLWFLIPAIILLFVGTWSIYASLKRKQLADWILTLMIVGLSSYSALWLYGIFINDGYPSYVPHILIGISALVGLVQKFKN